MKIMPVDIIHKHFGKKMMGLDPDEVSDFLRQIAQDMESLIKERNQLRETLREKELTIIDYKERDQTLKSTIATASQMADKLRIEAEREAKLLIQDAQHKADQTTKDARESLKKMYNEISELKRSRMQFEANLKAMIQAHLGLLEQSEKYMPQMQVPNFNFNQGPQFTDIIRDEPKVEQPAFNQQPKLNFSHPAPTISMNNSSSMNSQSTTATTVRTSSGEKISPQISPLSARQP